MDNHHLLVDGPKIIFPIHPSLHAENRTRLIDAFHHHFTQSNSNTADISGSENVWMLFQGGVSSFRDATDHEHVFRQESFFHWLFGVEEPDYWGAIHIDPNQPVAFLFMPRLPSEYSIWMGHIATTEEMRNKYRVDYVYYLDDMDSVFANHHRPGSTKIYLLQGVNSDSKRQHKASVDLEQMIPSTMKSANLTLDTSNSLFEILSNLRTIKTEREIEVMKFVSLVSSAAHVHVMKLGSSVIGMYEYQLESEFLHFVYKYGGCRHVSYTCICGSGPNSSILHYGHAGAPNSCRIDKDCMLLRDMGGEYCGYASDITVSYPVSGKFTDLQKRVYNAVLAASQAVIKSVKPGVSWVDMHLLAERVMLSCLIDANFLIRPSSLQNHGSKESLLDELMESRTGALFMPHGLGHLIGVDTHDVGGYTECCPPRSKLPGLRSLRTSRILEENMCVTVEPGMYFIPSLLEGQDKQDEFANMRKYLNMDLFRQHDLLNNSWGVRIEDVVRITKDGCELLSCVPRTVEEVESVCSLGIGFDPLDKQIDAFYAKHGMTRTF